MPHARQVKNIVGYRIDTMGNNSFFVTSDYPTDFPHTPAKHVKHYAQSGFEGILVVPAVATGTTATFYDHDQMKISGPMPPPVINLLVLDQHIDRMFRTMQALLIARPEGIDEKVKEFNQAFPNKEPSMPIAPADQKYLELTKEKVKEAIMQVIRLGIKRGDLDPAKLVYVRPNFYRDEKEANGLIVPGLGVASLGHHAVLEIFAVNVPPYLASAPASGARVLVFEKALFPKEMQEYFGRVNFGLQSPLRKIKAGGNYALGGQAKNLALYYGCDEALIIDPDGMVLEGGGENTWTVRNKKLCTPSLDQSVLPGTKRALVLEMAEKLGIPVYEGKIPLTEFIEGEAGGFSGTWCGFEDLGTLYWLSKGKQSHYSPTNEIMVTLKSEYNYLITGDPRLDSHLRDLEAKVRTPVILY